MEKEKKSSREKKKFLSGNIPEAHHLLMSLTGLHASVPPLPLGGNTSPVCRHSG